MWTQGQVNVLSSRQSVELDCEFYADSFNMFRNPVTWKKHQRQEQTDINIMGNILPPFFDTNRFIVSFSNGSPRYRLKLLISGKWFPPVTCKSKAVYFLAVCEMPRIPLLSFVNDNSTE